MNRAASWGGLFALVLANAIGCAAPHGTAIRTGAIELPPHVGEVAVYIENRPDGLADLGVVEVHAAQTEANVETLFPLFIERVASLGGDVAVIDNITARFHLVTQMYRDTFPYQCGYGTCLGYRSYPITSEVVVVSIAGRAMSTRVRSAPEAGRP